ncbi:MAG: hypothetical protein DI531_15915 [Brevundimonas sp.]|uniref:hypothetical protein n=1 Tax=Brevundimonas sp. TaxID=1871086 RepID=UPI000DB459E8|nr:hypothetical protein [Brevundimonas sp.]PZU71436.1 MAG: hypothetical protein DI531_15915 [Brevundimonas sp.]
MVTVATRITKIHIVEGFDIEVRNRKTGKKISESRQGVMGPYDFKARLADKKTVGDWMRCRFEPSFEDLTCEVLDGRGFAVDDDTPLAAVRASYFVEAGE